MFLTVHNNCFYFSHVFVIKSPNLLEFRSVGIFVISINCSQEIYDSEIVFFSKKKFFSIKIVVE